MICAGSVVGKRSDFARLAGDFYETPFEAALPLVSHLDRVGRYIEPCCGNGALVEHLAALKPELSLAAATDIRFGLDALTLTPEDIARQGVDAIITNPPWTRDILHALIGHFSDLAPAWLLFDADWMHTKQAALSLTRCSHIVSVGRVRWIRDSANTGKDNCAWYRFHHAHQGPTRFYGREL